MHEMTIGKVFVLYDGMVQYVKLTNPWGSGETDDAPAAASSSVRESVAADEPGAVGILGPVVSPNVYVGRVADAPADVRELIEQLEGR